MYILAQKLQKIFSTNDKKISLSSFRQYALFFSFIYFISVIILIYYIPSEDLKTTEPNYNDGIIISNQKLQPISRHIPLYTINLSNNTVIGSIRISSSKHEKNKFELSGFLYFTYNKSNTFNMKYLLVSGQSCHKWNITQDISNKITFKSHHQETKIFKKIRETSFGSNKIESASHFVIIQNFGRKYRQIACNSLNNALRTNTF